MFLSLDILIKEVVTERSCRFFLFAEVARLYSKVLENMNIFGCLCFKYVIWSGVIEIENRY